MKVCPHCGSTELVVFDADNDLCKGCDKYFSAVKDIDCDYVPFPTCPYCGEEDQDWWDGLGRKEDGDSWEVSCPHCDREYEVVMTVDVSFSSEPVAKNERNEL